MSPSQCKNLLHYKFLKYIKVANALERMVERCLWRYMPLFYPIIVANFCLLCSWVFPGEGIDKRSILRWLALWYTQKAKGFLVTLMEDPMLFYKGCVSIKDAFCREILLLSSPNFNCLVALYSALQYLSSSLFSFTLNQFLLYIFLVDLHLFWCCSSWIRPLPYLVRRVLAIWRSHVSLTLSNTPVVWTLSNFRVCTKAERRHGFSFVVISCLSELQPYGSQINFIVAGMGP